LESIEKNKRRIARWYDKKVKEFAKEIWYRSSYYRSASGILNMGSGHPIGKDHIKSVNACQAMHIYWRHWKEKSFPEH
jgi:hypothetical protein